jgi:hypothetical protein
MAQDAFIRPETVEDSSNLTNNDATNWSAASAQRIWSESTTAPAQTTAEPSHLEFTALFPAATVQQQPGERPPVQAVAAQPGDAPQPVRAAQQEAPAGPVAERPRLSSEQITQLINGPNGLGSSVWRDRDASHRALQEQGVNALPALLAAMRNPESSLEVRRRAESLTGSIVNSGVSSLLNGLGSNDAAVSQASELLLGRQSTDSLLASSTREELSPDHRRVFNQIIRTRLNEQQLQAMSNGGKMFFHAAPDETSLRTSIAASDVLGTANPSAQYQLGALLMQRGESGRAEAERALTRSLTGNQDSPSRASAQRMLAELAFQRGDNARGLEMSRESLRSLRAGSGDPSSALLLNEFRAVAQLGANPHRPLTPAQSAELGSIRQDATNQGQTYSAAHNAYMRENNKERVLGN